MIKLAKSIARAIQHLDPAVMGLMSGFGVNKPISKAIAKKLTQGAEQHTKLLPLNWRQRRILKKEYSGNAPAVQAQRELQRASKTLYEGGKIPDLAYEVSGGGKVQFPRRLRGGLPQLTAADKLLYRTGKYGPTAIASGATAALAYKVSNTEQTNPVKLSTNYND